MASETLNRLVALERAMHDVKTEVAGTNARLDVVVIRLDHMVALLERMVVVRGEFEALERRVTQLEGRG